MATPDNVPSGPSNRLLAALPDEESRKLQPHLAPVNLVREGVLVEDGERFEHVYFLERGVVSLVCAFEDGAFVGMSTIGCEGVVGASALLACEKAVGRHMVQVPGSALAIEFGTLQTILPASPALRALGRAYVQAHLAQVLQSVACNAVHDVIERCARWLLMTHDRSGGDTFALTHELLAEMLGVHRPTVTRVAGILQRAGLIRYSRGAISVVDRQGLEEASCECYGIIRRHYERLLPHTYC